MTAHVHQGIRFRRPDPTTEPSLALDPSRPWVAEHGPYRIVVFKGHRRVPFANIYRLDPALKTWTNPVWIFDVCLLNGIHVEGSTLDETMENAVKAMLDHEQTHGPTFSNAVQVPPEKVRAGDLFHHKGTFFSVDNIQPRVNDGGFSIFGFRGLTPVSLWLSPSSLVTIAAR